MADDGETKDDVKIPDGEVGEKIEKLFKTDEKDTSKSWLDQRIVVEVDFIQMLSFLLPWGKRWLLKPRKLPPRVENRVARLASRMEAIWGIPLCARCNFSGRWKLAAQLILLDFMIILPEKVSLVAEYTFSMYKAMDIAFNDNKDDTNVEKGIYTRIFYDRMSPYSRDAETKTRFKDQDAGLPRGISTLRLLILQSYERDPNTKATNTRYNM